MQINYANALRGIADVKPLMLIAFIAFFVISLPWAISADSCWTTADGRLDGVPVRTDVGGRDDVVEIQKVRKIYLVEN